MGKRGPQLSLRVLTRDPLTAPEVGHRLMAVLEDLAPALVPDRYGPVEPLEGRYGDGGAQRLVATGWDQRQLLWAGRDPRWQGDVWFRRLRLDLLGRIGMTGPLSDEHDASLLAVLRALVLACDAEFAVLHPLTAADRARGRPARYVGEERRDGTEPFLSVLPIQLERAVPDLFWCTAFGPRYVELLGRERLDRLRGCAVEWLDDEHVLLRLAERAAWVVEHPAEFEARRAEVKRALGEDVFFRVEGPGPGGYRVPDLTPPA